jgi:hypothetical protein
VRAREKMERGHAVPGGTELEHMLEKFEVSHDERDLIVVVPFVIPHGEDPSQYDEGLHHVIMLVARNFVLSQ